MRRSPMWWWTIRSRPTRRRFFPALQCRRHRPDDLLDVSETWQYTASHTVTQAELDAGTAIVNTATVTGTGAAPDTDDASVTVAQSQDPAHREGRHGSGRHGELDRRRHQLHAGGDQHRAMRRLPMWWWTIRSRPTRRRCCCAGSMSATPTGRPARRQRDLAVHGQPYGDAGRARQHGATAHRQHGDGERRRGRPGYRRRLGAGGAEQDPAPREGRHGSGRHGELDRRRHQLHAGGDQQGQCGDRQCGGGRSVHDQRGAGADRARPSMSATPTRTICSTSARPGSTRPAIR